MKKLRICELIKLKFPGNLVKVPELKILLKRCKI